MRVFVTGASGYLASTVIPELLSAGHEVTGLARSDRAAAAVGALGADVRWGDLDDLEGLGAAAREANGVVHLAFKHEQQHAGDLAGAVAADLRATEAMGAALEGSDKPFVGTGATLALILAGLRGRLTEHDAAAVGPRVDAENNVVALAGRGVRSSVVRLPTVHGVGGLGFISGLIAIARVTGTAGYLGGGDNRWAAVDVRDVGRLYRLALESAPAGSRLNAAAEEGIALRDIAEVIGRRLGVPVARVAAGDAEGHFGHLSMFVGLDNPTSSEITRGMLGWTPSRPGLIEDLDDERHFPGRGRHDARRVAPRGDVRVAAPISFVSEAVGRCTGGRPRPPAARPQLTSHGNCHVVRRRGGGRVRPRDPPAINREAPHARRRSSRAASTTSPPPDTTASAPSTPPPRRGCPPWPTRATTAPTPASGHRSRAEHWPWPTRPTTPCSPQYEPSVNAPTPSSSNAGDASAESDCAPQNQRHRRRNHRPIHTTTRNY